MKTSKIIRALIIILVLTLTLFVAMPQNSASALSLDEIIDNPDNITQITLPLHYSNTSDKNKALNEIRNEYKKEKTSRGDNKSHLDIINELLSK